MDELYDDLYFFFYTREHQTPGKPCPIEHIPGGYTGYSYYQDNEVGVFVPGEDVDDFRESFSNVILESAEIGIGELKVRGLRLRCPDVRSPDELGPFTVLCVSFLDTENGHREKLMSDPDRWCEIWRSTLGNKNYEKNAYPVIAELMLIEELLDKGYSPKWQGPSRGVNDVVTSAPKVLKFEVKSTLSRGSNSVKMSEEFQAANADYLCFYRFEEVSAGGTSINSLYSILIDKGLNKAELDNGLLKAGLIDTAEKEREYNLIEKKVYPINEGFPDIMNYFASGVKPDRINNISYSVDLSGLETTEIPDLHEYRGSLCLASHS